MPGVSAPQINVPRIIRGPSSLGITIDPSLKSFAASGHGTDLFPGTWLTGLDAALTTVASAETTMSYVVKSIFDQYGHMLPYQNVTAAVMNAANTFKASVAAIGGIQFEISEDGLSGSVADGDVGQWRRIVCLDLTLSHASYRNSDDNPIGSGPSWSIKLDSDVAVRASTLNGADHIFMLGQSDSADNPSSGARNWRVKVDTAAYSQT